MKLKKLFREVIFFIIFIVIASAIIGYIRAPKGIENISFIKKYKTIDGNKIDFKNKKIILYFWGSWCPICKKELSTLNKLALKKDRDYILITIASNSGSNRELKEFLKQRDLNFLVINDIDGEIAKSFGINVFPSTLYYNKNGELKLKDSGYTSYLGFLARVKAIGD
ncbi:MAG: redoxin domain-containing protein [Epsilonproteobacteria bacterium]|nr:redoxin domain-containing protein [Campylobacterota bacterium]